VVRCVPPFGEDPDLASRHDQRSLLSFSVGQMSSRVMPSPSIVSLLDDDGTHRDRSDEQRSKDLRRRTARGKILIAALDLPKSKDARN
jgi:hypothetical protein